MAQQLWDNKITKTQDWGGDSSTSNLPVSGRRVQEFIKEGLDSKMGNLYYDPTSNRYLVFADEVTKLAYLEDPTKTSLLLGAFDAPFNYTAFVTFISQINTVIFKGDTGNYLEFTFDVTDKSGSPTLEPVNITYTFINGNNKRVVTEQYNYGTKVSFNLDTYLATGENIIQIGVVGAISLAAITKSVTYRVLDLALSSTYDISQMHDLSVASYIQIPFYTKSSRHLFLRASIDYEAWIPVMETDSYETNGTYSLSVDLLGIGVHNIRLQAYNLIDGVAYYSDFIYKEFLLNQNNQLTETQILISGVIPANITDLYFKLYGLTQYVPATIEVAVYNPVSSPTSTAFALVQGGESYPISNKSISNYQTELITFTPLVFGTSVLSITTGTTSKTIDTSILNSPIQIAEITSQLVLSLKALGRSNADANKTTWSYGPYSATFTNFSWNARSGWINNRLKVNHGAYVDINIAPLANNPELTGYTMEFEYSTELINNENAVLIDLRNGDTGLLLTASKASLTSANGRKLETQFKDGENVRIGFVIDNTPILSSKVMYIYINGVVSGAIDFLNTDSFTLNNTLRIGNTQEAILNIKDIRFYNRALSATELLNNYILYRDTSEEMLSVFNRNNVLTDGRISADVLANILPVIIFTGDVPVLENTTDKGLPITVDIVYINRQDPTRSFTMENAQLRPQGTSSMFYPKKNFRIYTKKNPNTVVKDYLGVVIANKLYSFKQGAIPVHTWCLKADYAESSSTHNTGVSRIWNDALANMQIAVNGVPTYAGRTNAQVAALANNYQYDVRTAIDGFPIVAFYQLTKDDPLIFLGKYNFNNDKSTENVFGFKDIPGFNNARMQCWEMLDSGNEYALFTGDPAYWDANWANVFEGRYPDASQDTVDLKAFYTWVYNNRENQSTFDAEMADHMDLYKMAAYYVYLMRFGAVDQVAKNSMLTSEDGIHFYFINYDNDTVLGLDNDGKLVYDWRIDRQTKLPNTDIYAYAAAGSALWNRLEGSVAFMDLVKKVDMALFEARKGTVSVGITQENVLQMFNELQSDKWSEVVYNEDAQYKYLGPYKNNSINQLPKLQGRRALHRTWWINNRFNYLDGKWMSGKFTKDGITFKCHAGNQGTTLKITSGIDMYFGIKVQSTMIQSQYLELDQSYDFAVDRNLQIGSPVSICNPANVAGLDLSNFMINLATIDITLIRNAAGETRLKKLVLGNSVDINSIITNISGLENATALQELNIEGFTAIQSLSLNEQYDLRKLYALRSGLRDLTLSQGCPIEVLHLPNTLIRLSLDSHAKLTNANLIVPYTNIEELIIKDCTLLDTLAIFTSYVGAHIDKSALQITLWGINWTDISASQLLNLLEGITSSNINLKGVIRLSECNQDQILAIKAIFGQNCFNRENELYISAPDALYIDGPLTILEGQSAQFSHILFTETTGTLFYLISNGIRAGTTINSNTGLLTSTENGLSDSTLVITVVYYPHAGGQDFTAQHTLIVRKKIYPTSGTITGKAYLDVINIPEAYTLNLLPEGHNSGYSATWSLTGDLASSVQLLTSNNTNCTLRLLNLPMDAVSFNLVATVTPTGQSPFTVTKLIGVFNPNIAIFASTNPSAMAKLYAAGLCSSSEYMTKTEAAAVTSIDSLAGMTDSSADFLKWFTNLTTIGNTFRVNHSITSVTLPPSLTSIGNDAFNGAMNLTSVIMPNSVTEIGAWAFKNCWALTSITLSTGLTRIQILAFEGTYNLIELFIPPLVNNLGARFVKDCTSLINITVDPANTTYSSIDGVLYNKSATRLHVVPAGRVGSFTTPTSVLNISEYAFGWCEKLTSIILTSVQAIDRYAFNQCLTLTELTIPSSIISVNDRSFENTPKLGTIRMYKSTPPTIRGGSPFGSSTSNYTGYNTTSKPNQFYVPADATGYESWNDTLYDPAKCYFVLNKTL